LSEYYKWMNTFTVKHYIEEAEKKFISEFVNDLKDWLKSPYRLIETNELIKILRKWEERL